MNDEQIEEEGDVLHYGRGSLSYLGPGRITMSPYGSICSARNLPVAKISTTQQQHKHRIQSKNLVIEFSLTIVDKIKTKTNPVWTKLLDYEQIRPQRESGNLSQSLNHDQILCQPLLSICVNWDEIVIISAILFDGVVGFFSCKMARLN